jgi:hypothetical protein
MGYRFRKSVRIFKGVHLTNVQKTGAAIGTLSSAFPAATLAVIIGAVLVTFLYIGSLG